MATADQLLEQMFSWIKQRELCAKQLRKLAQELESFGEKRNTHECVGSSVAVVEALSRIGAGVATVFTAGAAAPLFGVLGAAYTGVGVAISVAAKITEHFLSSSYMEEAQKTEEESNKIAERIQKLFQQLKAEVKNKSPSADPDEVDQHTMTEILRAVGRRSGLKWGNNLPQFDFDAGPGSMGVSQSSLKQYAGMVGLVGILAFFGFQVSGKRCESLLAQGAAHLIRKTSIIGLKTALRGGAKVVGGALGLVFSLPDAIDDWTNLIMKNHVTEASQSLRDTATAILEISQTLREQLHNNIKQMLETLAEVKLCIENSNRSSEQKQKLIKFAKEHSEEEAVKEWLKENSKPEVFFELVDMFYFLQRELDKEKKKIDRSEDLHITFVAHGEIEASLIPASCLLPQPSITDVLLYSPWNCFITSDAAYGVATGRVRPQHRIFCRPEGKKLIPDESRRPTNLPDRWNSMKKAKGHMIPNIIVSTLEKPDDAAWEEFLFLTDEYGQPERNRIVIPFILPGKSPDRDIPFFVITLALSLVLLFSQYKATVHLVACLGKTSEETTLNEADLNAQYACTVDDTAMTASEDMLVHRDSELYRALKAVFG